EFVAMGAVGERADVGGQGLDVRTRALSAALETLVIFLDDGNGDATDRADRAGFGHDASNRARDVAAVTPAVVERREVRRLGDFCGVDDEPSLRKLAAYSLRAFGKLEAVADDDIVSVAGIFKQRGFALRHPGVLAD